jgi:histidine triad (HIT) family protein
MPKETIFRKIIDKEIPSEIIYEDDLCLAFKDINPQAPVHILLIPKKLIPKLSDAQECDKELLGHLMNKVPEIAKLVNLNEGFRVVINNGKIANQTVFHLHLHILGGRDMSWPPG